MIFTGQSIAPGASTHRQGAAMLNEREMMRYGRQLTIKDWGIDAQEKLKKATVFIAGAGGLGSPLLYYLAVAGVGRLRVCDFDTIELSNLNRQILHPTKNVGRLKAESAGETLAAANGDVWIDVVKEKITRKNAAGLVGDARLIIDCLDNFEARHLLNRVSVEKRIPMVHAGVAGFQGQITFLDPPATPCLACFIPSKVKKEPVPIFGATPGVMGSMEAVEAIKYLTGLGDNLRNRLLLFDGAAMTFSTIKLSRNPKCKVCGGM